MEYAHNFRILIFALSMIASTFSCTDRCTDECFIIDFGYDFAILNEDGVDLLGGVSSDSISIQFFSSIKDPSLGNLEYELSDDFGGTFPTSATIVRVLGPDLFAENEEGDFERTLWTMNYSRNGQEFVDTIGHTPVDNSTECCVSLTTEDFTYSGNNVVSVTQEEGFPIYRVILR